MRVRHVVMGVALAGAAALTVFGDNRPEGAVAEAVERKPARSAANGPAPAQATPAPAALAATEGSSVAAAPSGAAPAGAAHAGSARPGEAAILRLLPREELIGAVGEGSFKSMDGVFGGQTWNPPPPPAPPESLKPQPPPPPTAPPLPFQFLGKAAADGQWEVYLGRGEQTFVVRKGSQIDSAYRVENIAPPTLTITYLPMNQVQQLHIGVIE